MRHIEIHLIESIDDKEALNLGGFNLSEVESCEECFEEVGEIPDSKFVPFVVCLDDEDEWIVCATCADPIL